MSINRKRLFISLGIIGLVIIPLISKILLDIPFRKQLPELPDFKSISIPLQEQISAASRKAYYNPTSNNLGNLGMVYHSSAYYDKAALCYKLAIKKNKSKWIWGYYLGYLNQEMGESNEAVRNFTEIVKENPKVYHAWYYIGESYQKLGENEKAEMAYNKIAFIQEDIMKSKTSRVNFFPLQENSKFQLARIYVNTNRADQAEKLLNDIINYNRTYSPVYRLLGNIYANKGDSIQSKRFILRAKDQADYTPLLDTLVDKLALISRSELYLPKQIDDAIKSANPEWALELLNNGLKYLPQNKHLIAKTIKFFLRMNVGKKALPYLNQHMQFFKDNNKELNEVADLLFKKGFYAEALGYYNILLKLTPQDAQIPSSIALCNWKLGKNETAITLMTQLVDRNGNNSKILANGASFMLLLGQKEKALIYLNKLSKIAPSNPQLLKLNATIAEKEGNMELAVSLYEKSFSGDPKDISTIQSLGSILLEKQMWEKSVRFFSKALEFHPNEPFLLERLGALLISCPDSKFRNVKEGKEFSERAFFNIASPTATIISAGRTLAQAYAVSGDFNSAKFYMNTILNMARNENVPPDYLQGLENLAKKIERFSQQNSNHPAPN